jgi:hypothetical protein
MPNYITFVPIVFSKPRKVSLRSAFMNFGPTPISKLLALNFKKEAFQNGETPS